MFNFVATVLFILLGYIAYAGFMTIYEAIPLPWRWFFGGILAVLFYAAAGWAVIFENEPTASDSNEPTTPEPEKGALYYARFGITIIVGTLMVLFIGTYA